MIQLPKHKDELLYFSDSVMNIIKRNSLRTDTYNSIAIFDDISFLDKKSNADMKINTKNKYNKNFRNIFNSIYNYDYLYCDECMTPKALSTIILMHPITSNKFSTIDNIMFNNLFKIKADEFFIIFDLVTDKTEHWIREAPYSSKLLINNVIRIGDYFVMIWDNPILSFSQIELPRDFEISMQKYLQSC